MIVLYEIYKQYKEAFFSHPLVSECVRHVYKEYKEAVCVCVFCNTKNPNKYLFLSFRTNPPAGMVTHQQSQQRQFITYDSL